MKNLTDEDASHAIMHHEFGPKITGIAENVVVIPSQNWCSQWQYLSKDLENHAKTGEADIHVFVFLYNRSPLFQEFMNFKETVWGNNQIPYLRFYRNGIFFFESNFLPAEEIIRKFVFTNQAG